MFNVPTELLTGNLDTAIVKLAEYATVSRQVGGFTKTAQDFPAPGLESMWSDYKGALGGGGTGQLAALAGTGAAVGGIYGILRELTKKKKSRRLSNVLWTALLGGATAGGGGLAYQNIPALKDMVDSIGTKPEEAGDVAGDVAGGGDDPVKSRDSSVPLAHYPSPNDPPKSKDHYLNQPAPTIASLAAKLQEDNPDMGSVEAHLLATERLGFGYGTGAAIRNPITTGTTLYAGGKLVEGLGNRASKLPGAAAQLEHLGRRAPGTLAPASAGHTTGQQLINQINANASASRQAASVADPSRWRWRSRARAAVPDIFNLDPHKAKARADIFGGGRAASFDPISGKWKPHVGRTASGPGLTLSQLGKSRRAGRWSRYGGGPARVAGKVVGKGGKVLGVAGGILGLIRLIGGSESD